jgi:transposase
VPLSAITTAANIYDVTMLDQLLDAIPPLRGRRGRPPFRPEAVQADRGYDSDPLRDRLRRRGIRPELARRDRPHGSGLGRTRWVVERTLSWLHQSRLLRVRGERRADIHEGLVSLACALITYESLERSLCQALLGRARLVHHVPAS